MAMLTAYLLKQCSILLIVEYQRDASNEHGEAIGWEITARPFETADIQAIGAAVQNMLLQAPALSIDSLWMGDVLYAHDKIREYMGLEYPFIAAVALGKGDSPGNRMSVDEKVKRFRPQGT